MNDSLKPCPFCGLPAKYEYGEDWHEINCLCGYSFQHADRTYPNETEGDAMIRSWNTRPIEDNLNEVIADLVRQRDDCFRAADNYRKERDGTCIWSCDEPQNDDGWWNTECNNLFIFNSGTPEENEFTYCPYCGKRIKAQP